MKYTQRHDKSGNEQNENLQKHLKTRRMKTRQTRKFKNIQTQK